MGTCGTAEEKKQPVSNKSLLSTEEKAVLDCKHCRDNLKNYIKKLERSEKLQKDKAKEFLREKNRPRAKMCLNKSKIFSAQIESANNNLTVIEEQILRIEQTKSQAEVFKVLETGNAVLKELQKEVNIEKWESIRDDMDDIKAQQQEIGDFLKSHNINEEQFEIDIDNDLAKLMQQEGIKLENEMPSVPKKEPNLEKQLPDAVNKDLEKGNIEKVDDSPRKDKQQEEKVLVEEI